LTLTAGLGAGVALFGLVYFFAFQFNGNEWKWVRRTDPSRCKRVTICSDVFAFLVIRLATQNFQMDAMVSPAD
jgi:hypothetical protein